MSALKAGAGTAARACRKCKAVVAWVRVRLPGVTTPIPRYRKACLSCGAITTRIKGQRKALPRGLGEHSSLTKVADKLWSAAIHAKAIDGCCARCGKRRPLQAAHNIGRRAGGSIATRYELDNGLPLCYQCHNLIDNDAEEKRALFLGVLGVERYERLQLMKRGRGKPDLQLVILELRARVA